MLRAVVCECVMCVKRTSDRAIGDMSEGRRNSNRSCHGNIESVLALLLVCGRVCKYIYTYTRVYT